MNKIENNYFIYIHLSCISEFHPVHPVKYF